MFLSHIHKRDREKEIYYWVFLSDHTLTHVLWFMWNIGAFCKNIEKNTGSVNVSFQGVYTPMNELG